MPQHRYYDRVLRVHATEWEAKCECGLVFVDSTYYDQFFRPGITEEDWHKRKTIEYLFCLHQQRCSLATQLIAQRTKTWRPR